MKHDHFIYQWEREAVRLRYDEGLCRIQIADRLGMRFAQVKYIFSKPNVKYHIQKKVLPAKWRQELIEIEEKLADPFAAYIDYLIERTKAQRYQWFGPGQKHYQSDHRKRFRANRRLGRLIGLNHDQKTVWRDLRNAVQKRTEDLCKKRNVLQAHLAFVHKN